MTDLKFQHAPGEDELANFRSLTVEVTTLSFRGPYEDNVWCTLHPSRRLDLTSGNATLDALQHTGPLDHGEIEVRVSGELRNGTAPLVTSEADSSHEGHPFGSLGFYNVTNNALPNGSGGHRQATILFSVHSESPTKYRLRWS